MAILALVSDLMMQSQVRGAAERAGVAIALVASTDALVSKAASEKPKLVVIDLSHPGLEASQVVPQVKQHLADGGTLLAFGPHVHRDRLAAAQAAGADLVISRGQFHAQMEELLRQYA